MQRSRSKRKRAPKSYAPYYSSSESESVSEDDLGIVWSMDFGMELEFKVQMQPKKRTSTRSKKTKNKRPSDNYANCSKRAPKPKNGTPKNTSTKVNSNDKGKKKKYDEASVASNSHISLDSDDEMPSTSVIKTYTDDIKSKVDDFFKALESDEEVENNIPVNVPVDKKNEDFYTILSDSENEEDKKVKEKISSIINAPASTYGLFDSVTTDIKVDNDKVNSEEKTEDLLAYVDEILKETVDLADSSTKKNVPGLTLEDMKKKTDEILGDVASLIDNLKPKPKEPEKKDLLTSPAKEAPTCPICLEQLGGSRQAMATLCGHMFCLLCLEKVIKTTKKCPSCRKALTKTKYHPVYI